MSSIDSQLGGVKPWVRSAADQLASLFGLKTAYGYRAGDTADATTGHTAGLAVDFPVAKSVGDQLVTYIQAHAAALDVRYLIWQQRIWFPGKGWTSMAYRPGSRPGYDPNHLRHVHVSWNTTAPAAGATATATATPTASTTPTGATDVSTSMSLLDPSTWGPALMGGTLKVVGVVAGLTLVIMGMSGIVGPRVLKAAGQVIG